MQAETLEIACLPSLLHHPYCLPAMPKVSNSESSNQGCLARPLVFPHLRLVSNTQEVCCLFDLEDSRGAALASPLSGCPSARWLQNLQAASKILDVPIGMDHQLPQLAFASSVPCKLYVYRKPADRPILCFAS